MNEQITITSEMVDALFDVWNQFSDGILEKIRENSDEE